MICFKNGILIPIFDNIGRKMLNGLKFIFGWKILANLMKQIHIQTRSSSKLFQMFQSVINLCKFNPLRVKYSLVCNESNFEGEFNERGTHLRLLALIN